LCKDKNSRFLDNSSSAQTFPHFFTPSLTYGKTRQHYQKALFKDHRHIAVVTSLPLQEDGNPDPGMDTPTLALASRSEKDVMNN